MTTITVKPPLTALNKKECFELRYYRTSIASRGALAAEKRCLLAPSHLNDRAREVHEMSAYQQRRQPHGKGRAQAGDDQDRILRLLEHGYTLAAARVRPLLLTLADDAELDDS